MNAHLELQRLQAETRRTFLTRSNLTEKQFRDELRYQLLMEKVALKESPVTDEDLIQYEVRMMVAPDNKEAAGEGGADPSGGGPTGEAKPPSSSPRARPPKTRT